jgi:hypothetical protein
MSAARRSARALVAASLLFAGPVLAADPAPGRIAVEFVAPEKFTDAKATALPSETETRHLLADLARFVQQAAVRHVPPERSLAVRVTDVDRAGEFEPWRGPQFTHAGSMRENYPPRIELEFTLREADGRVVAGGVRTLRDPLSLTRSVRVADDRLRYEKSLVEDWLRTEFAR